MEVKRILGDERLTRATTSLTAVEFQELLPPFEEAWEKTRQTSKTKRGTERIKKAADRGKLAGAEAKLFFLLFYYKAYPTQDVMAALFGITQPQVNAWVHQLTPLVEAALGEKLLKPARTGRSLERVLAETPGLGFILDGTERPVRRPKQKEAQKAKYSGKKKRHTLKNLVVVDPATGKIAALTPTEAGSRHDKALADEASIPWPKGSRILADSGFQGYGPEGAKVIAPFKKTKGKELPEAQKEFNRSLAKIRVRVEHALSGVKRCNIVSHVHRNYKSGFADAAMEVVCGLHNLRRASRRTF